MVTTYNSKDLADFANYILSDERKESKRMTFKIQFLESIGLRQSKDSGVSLDIIDSQRYHDYKKRTNHQKPELNEGPMIINWYRQLAEDTEEFVHRCMNTPNMMKVSHADYTNWRAKKDGLKLFQVSEILNDGNISFKPISTGEGKIYISGLSEKTMEQMYYGDWTLQFAKGKKR